MDFMVDKPLLDRRYAAIGEKSPLFYDEPLHLVKGEGVWVYDSGGKKYLDAYNNVPHVGHCNQRVVQAVTDQLATFNSHTRYLHENLVSYVERLTSKFSDPLDMMILTCTGSEANEAALRLARNHTRAQGIIVTNCSYHGNTEAVAELGFAFMPEAQTTQRVLGFTPPCTYRMSDHDVSGEIYLQEIRQAITQFKERGIGLAGILLCPAFANEGLINSPPGFVRAAVDLVRAEGGLFIADEVQGGFGRTGKWWSHQWEDVVPDIVTLGKPMGNGYPLAGVVSSAELVNEFSEWGMYFNTFAGGPVACAAGAAVMDVIEQESLIDRAAEVGDYLAQKLRSLQGKYEIIGDVRHKGLIFAVELVTNRAEKTPATKEAGKIVNAMCREGVLISRIGTHDSVLKVRPPMVFEREHADLLIEKLDTCISEGGN